MKTKWPLYLGIAFLIVGIVLRVLSINLIAMVLIGSGVMLKILYLLKNIIGGKYKPGYEFILLIVGLALFGFGIYMRNNFQNQYYIILYTMGIMLKASFVIVFIKKIRK